MSGCRIVQPQTFPRTLRRFLASPKDHKSNSGKGGAMLGVPFQSVKDGFLDLFDSTFLDAKARFERFSRFHSGLCFKPTRSCLFGLADYHGGPVEMTPSELDSV